MIAKHSQEKRCTFTKFSLLKYNYTSNMFDIFWKTMSLFFWKLVTELILRSLKIKCEMWFIARQLKQYILSRLRFIYKISINRFSIWWTVNINIDKRRKHTLVFELERKTHLCIYTCCSFKLWYWTVLKINREKRNHAECLRYLFCILMSISDINS